MTNVLERKKGEGRKVEGEDVGGREEPIHLNHCSDLHKTYNFLIVKGLTNGIFQLKDYCHL